jgi:hypothetical protein
LRQLWSATRERQSQKLLWTHQCRNLTDISNKLNNVNQYRELVSIKNLKQMRRINLLTVALTALTIVSCSNEENFSGGLNPQDGNSYISIAIQAPAASDLKTRTGGDVVASGTELAVTDAIYFGFNAAGVCLNAGPIEGITTDTGTETGGVATPTVSNSIPVSNKVTQLFVVVNPTAALTAVANNSRGMTFDVINEAVIGITALAEYADATDIMMTNSEGLHVFTHSTAGSVTALTVTVDRVVSKISLDATSTPTVPTGVVATVEGFDLNTTNKSMFPYAKYATYNTNVTESYRIDPNYTTAVAGVEPLKAAFNWITNSTVAETLF